jgi:hypothetical protein
MQAQLGHASIQMTADRYGHLFSSADDSAELAAAEKAFGQRWVAGYVRLHRLSP